MKFIYKEKLLSLLKDLNEWFFKNEIYPGINDLYVQTGSDNQVYVNIYLSYKDNDTLCLDYKIQPKDYANNAAYIILHYYPEYDICHFNCDVEGAWIEVLEMGVLTTKEILDYGINLTFIKEDSR